MARTEHLKAATLAPAGLRSSVRFEITRPGRFIFLLLGKYWFLRWFFMVKNDETSSVPIQKRKLKGLFHRFSD
jgi:hypothetical protein